MALGSFALPGVVSAADAPTFRVGLTLAPVQVFVTDARQRPEFMIYNTGQRPEPITVSASDDWLTPSVPAFTLQPGERMPVYAILDIPANRDDGDHRSQLTFATALQDLGMTRTRAAIAGDVLFGPFGVVRHGLRWDRLHVPTLVDPTAGPVLLSVRAVNEGNTHETLDPVLGDVENWPWGHLTGQNDTIARFEPTILLRGDRRTLRAQWSPPWVPCWCHVYVRGLTADAVVFPFRAVAFLIAVMALLYAWRLRKRWRR
jgi:hypothetical protein